MANRGLRVNGGVGGGGGGALCGILPGGMLCPGAGPCSPANPLWASVSSSVQGLNRMISKRPSCSDRGAGSVVLLALRTPCGCG